MRNPHPSHQASVLVAERLATHQAIALLTLLRDRGEIHGLGTPSRVEAITPSTPASSTAAALGTTFTGTPMDGLVIEMSTKIASSSLVDISTRTVKMSTGRELDVVIAQVYPSDTSEGAGMTDAEFSRFIQRYVGEA